MQNCVTHSHRCGAGTGEQRRDGREGGEVGRGKEAMTAAEAGRIGKWRTGS